MLGVHDLKLKEVGDLGAQWLHLRHQRLHPLALDGSIEEFRFHRTWSGGGGRDDDVAARQGGGQGATAFTEGVAGVGGEPADEPAAASDLVADAVVVHLVEDVVGVLGEVGELQEKAGQLRAVGDVPALRLVQQALRVEELSLDGVRVGAQVVAVVQRLQQLGGQQVHQLADHPSRRSQRHLHHRRFSPAPATQVFT